MVAAASVPPNVHERSNFSEGLTFGGTEAAATGLSKNFLFG